MTVMRRSYRLVAPFYDRVVGPRTEVMRRDSLRAFDARGLERVLLPGIGTGLDLPFLAPGPRWIGLDLTPAMLEKARRRAQGREDVCFVEGDAHQLPFRDGRVDAVILHFILAVVPQPALLLAEASRVVVPGGAIIIVDKFLRSGQWALLRRFLGLFVGTLLTRTNVVFEDLLDGRPELERVEDRPVLARGWFRRIVVRKRAEPDSRARPG